MASGCGQGPSSGNHCRDLLILHPPGSTRCPGGHSRLTQNTCTQVCDSLCFSSLCPQHRTPAHRCVAHSACPVPMPTPRVAGGTISALDRTSTFIAVLVSALLCPLCSPRVPEGLWLSRLTKVTLFSLRTGLQQVPFRNCQCCRSLGHQLVPSSSLGS